ncbi:MAG: ATP-binding protein [archaeon]
MQCSICKKNAVISRQYEGRALCRKHFFDSVDKNMRKTIRLDGLMPRGAHVAVGVSGDNDSMLLLYLLHKLNKMRGDLKISAVFADEGIRGYRKKMISQARRFCRDLNVPFFLVTYKDVFGVTIDEVSRKLDGKDADVCVYCRELRESLLKRKAIEINADRIALASNMDDEVQAIIAKYFGYDAPVDIGEVVNVPVEDEDLIKIIKPLSIVPENETALYARLKKIECMPMTCPYGETSFRYKIRGILNDLEEKHAGIKFNILKTEQKIRMVSEKV